MVASNRAMTAVHVAIMILQTAATCYAVSSFVCYVGTRGVTAFVVPPPLAARRACASCAPSPLLLLFVVESTLLRKDAAGVRPTAVVSTCTDDVRQKEIVSSTIDNHESTADAGNENTHHQKKGRLRERRQRWISESLQYYAKVMRGSSSSGNDPPPLTPREERFRTKIAQDHYFAIQQVRAGNFRRAEHVYRMAIDEIAADPDRCDDAKLATSTLLLALVLQRANKIREANEVFERFFLDMGIGASPSAARCHCPCTARVLGAYSLFLSKYDCMGTSLEMAQKAIQFDPKLLPLIRWKKYRVHAELSGN